MQDRLSLEGEGLFHRVDDHHEVPAGAAAGNALDDGCDFRHGREKVADQNGFVECRDRRPRREVVVERPAVGDERLGHLFGDQARRPRRHQAEKADPLAGLDEGIGKGKPEHEPPFDLGGKGEFRHVGHRGGAIDPQPDRMCGLPFALAHIKAIVAGGAAPVDALRRFAGHEGPELPKAFAGTGPPPAVDAVGKRRGNAPRLQDQAGHPLRERQPGVCLLTAWRSGVFGEDPNTGHGDLNRTVPSGGR